MDGLGRTLHANLIDVVGVVQIFVGVWLAVAMAMIIAYLVVGAVVKWLWRQDSEGLVIGAVGLIVIVIAGYWLWMVTP